MKVKLPLKEGDISRFKSGEKVLLSGVMYSARDAAHKRMADIISGKGTLPFDIKNAVIYYVGPTPAGAGRVIGSAGPTSSYRMDIYMEELLKMGLKGTIGKGKRGWEVRDAMLRNKAVYFTCCGGAGALLARHIKKADIIAFEDLGAEAIMRLEVEDFPVFVVNDIYGNDLYEAALNRSELKIRGV